MCGKGTVAIKTTSGTKLLENVMYVPQIDQNLISVGQLVNVGYKLHFEDGVCIIKDCNGVDMMSIAMKNRSFPLYLNESSIIAYTSLEDQSSFMHKRLRHCSYSTLREVTRHSLIEDMPSMTLEDSICRVCEERKSFRASFSLDPVRRAKVKL